MIREKIKGKIRGKNLCSLLLPEAKDPRVLKAAAAIVEDDLTKRVMLLGNPEEIYRIAKTNDIKLPQDITIIDHINSPSFDDYVKLYLDLNSARGTSKDEAVELLKTPVYYGMCMVRTGEVDTCVCGSVATTPTVLRATLRILGLKPGVRTLSSCFLMITKSQYGENGVFLFADAGAVPDPSPQQLAQIAISTAETARLLLETEPRVAMLSFSTKGSAHHKLVEKVIKATELAKQDKPELLIDGELQADAAIVPEVATIKLKESPVAGKANVLIFPDLNSGNICYKLVERLAGAEAFGPLIQGAAVPVSDLSRGCSASDIISVSAITILRTAIEKGIL